MTVLCQCGREAELVECVEIYGSWAEGRDLPPRYLCRPCDAHVGTHAGTDPPEPLGTLAGPELRGLRRRCHEIIDPPWEDRDRKGRRRKAVYRTLRKVMDQDIEECHVGEWTIETCLIFLALAEEFVLKVEEAGLK